MLRCGVQMSGGAKALPLISAQELAKHNTKEDLWVAFHGKACRAAACLSVQALARHTAVLSGGLCAVLWCVV